VTRGAKAEKDFDILERPVEPRSNEPVPR